MENAAWLEKGEREREKSILNLKWSWHLWHYWCFADVLQGTSTRWSKYQCN